MKRGTPQHPKIEQLAYRLSARAGIPFDLAVPLAVGMMEMLWHFTARYAPDGAIGQHPAHMVARRCGWIWEPEELMPTLAEVGLVDAQEGLEWVVHDWHIHADDTCRKALEAEGRCFWNGAPARTRKARNTGNGGGPGPQGPPDDDSRTTRESLASGSPSPSLAKPNQAKPSQASLPATEVLEGLLHGTPRGSRGAHPSSAEVAAAWELGVEATELYGLRTEERLTPRARAHVEELLVTCGLKPHARKWVLAFAAHGYVCRCGLEAEPGYAPAQGFKLRAMTRPGKLELNLATMREAWGQRKRPPFSKGDHASVLKKAVGGNLRSLRGEPSG